MVVNEAAAAAAALDAAANEKLPMGHYTLVSIDIDTTGRRLIDEIVQLAAFSPKSHYEQYIMPYMNLNPAARQRHQVRVISIGFYRMLKSMQTCKIIKSKSEIAALKDFLDWLEDLKAKDEKSLGVILVCHEDRKFIPYMILQAFNKYNLLARFLNTVAAFTNSRVLAQQLLNKEGALRQPYTLRRLARYINMKIVENDTENEAGATAIARVCGNSHGNEEFDGNASVRARLTYEVAHYLCNLEHNNNNNTLDSNVGYEHLLAALLKQAQPIQADLCELETQNENVERQNSFRPVFFVYFRATLFHRMRAVKFRIILAEHGFDLNTLNAIWQEEGRDGLLCALQTVAVLKPEERHELVDLLDSYFDPKKTVVGPVVKNNRRRNRRSSNTRNGTKNEGNSARAADEPGAGGDKQQIDSAAGILPDSTTKSLSHPIGGGNNYNKTGRGKRFNPRVRNGFRQPRFNQQHARSQNAGVAVMNSGGNMGGAAALPQAQRVAVAN